MKKTKFLILGLLFIAPLVFFLFLASGRVHFEKLPLITQKIKVPPKNFKNKITVFSFLEADFKEADYFQLMNLYQVIYKNFEKYKKFQMVTFYSETIAPKKLQKIKKELARVGAIDLKKWIFIPQKKINIQETFNSFGFKKITLKDVKNISKVFLIDEKLNLRARIESENLFFSYDTNSVSLLKNKLKDDILVLLYESKFAKKYEK